MDKNPVIYFEIPVLDINRAEYFYSHVFGFSFDREIIDGYEMAFFPFHDHQRGISGALAKGDVYKPTKNGIIIYFVTDSIEDTLQKSIQHGGGVLYPKTYNEKYQFFVAELEDSEGNRIAIQEFIRKKMT